MIGAQTNMKSVLLMSLAMTVFVSVSLGSLVNAEISLVVTNFIEGTCNSTSYPKVCVKTLNPLAASIEIPHMSEVATVAVNDSLVSCVKTSRWFTIAVNNATLLLQIAKPALEDCVQNFVEIKDQIEQSLYILRHLSADDMRLQMSDVQTYMSAALTNVDSCLYGVKYNSEVTLRVRNFMKITSNTLALVNMLAESSSLGSYSVHN